MKPMLQIALPVLAVIAALIVISATLKEGRGDERDKLQLYMASRAAFILGLVVLSVGTIWQTLTHTIDPWLVGTLIAITLGKAIGFLHAKYKT